MRREQSHGLMVKDAVRSVTKPREESGAEVRLIFESLPLLAGQRVEEIDLPVGQARREVGRLEAPAGSPVVVRSDSGGSEARV